MPKQYVAPLDSLDLTVSNDTTEPIEIGRWDLIRFQPRAATGTWGAGEVVAEFSLDGSAWANLPDLGEVLFTAAAMTKAFHVPAVKRMRFRVKTTQAGACTVEVPCVVDTTRLEEIVQVSSGGFS